MDKLICVALGILAVLGAPTRATASRRGNDGDHAWSAGELRERATKWRRFYRVAYAGLTRTQIDSVKDLVDKPAGGGKGMVAPWPFWPTLSKKKAAVGWAQHGLLVTSRALRFLHQAVRLSPVERAAKLKEVALLLRMADQLEPRITFAYPHVSQLASLANGSSTISD